MVFRERYNDLLVVLDDASEIYYAQLVQEKSTRAVTAALREVIERAKACSARFTVIAVFFFDPEGRREGESPCPDQIGRAMKSGRLDDSSLFAASAWPL